VIVHDIVGVDKIQVEVVKLITCRLDLGIGVAMSLLPLHRLYRFLRAIRYSGYTIYTSVYVHGCREGLTRHGHP
jgi:hypothetical protein